MEYPSNKLEIQVLDDSTDESVIETARLVKELQEKGIDIQHIRRTNRQGFKAGALKEGLEVAKGEFIAIFDADFLPESDWLKKTVTILKILKLVLFKLVGVTLTAIIRYLLKFKHLLWMPILH